MTGQDPQAAAGGQRPRARLRSLLLPVGASLLVVLTGSAVAAPPLSRATREARQLDSALTRSARTADRTVRPMARRLAAKLTSGAERLQALREPASTAQEQVEIALDQLRQMSLPAMLDPHYAPALLAAGRAFVAASGEDPLTHTTIDPEYSGLASELAASEARLAGSAGLAVRLAARAGRLSRALARTRRRAGRLARLLRHDSASGRRR